MSRLHNLINFKIMTIFSFCICSTANAEYTYIPPAPTLGENSFYTINEITKEEYEALVGIDEVFVDAYVKEKDLIEYHYYKYAEKPDLVSTPPVTSSNGGQDINGGFYAQFGSFDGRAINLRSGSIGNVQADFVNNAVNSSSGGYGGALYMEYSTIASITGDFINNHVDGGSGNAYGGAIYTNLGAKITDGIKGNFIGNYITGNRYIFGGALLLEGANIKSIEGKFINNAVYSESGGLGISGGALTNGHGRNTSVIESINADFVHNFIKTKSQGTGGALANIANIGSLKGNFIENYIETDRSGKGGAIHNTYQIGYISSNFIGNYIKSTSATASALGGAIHSTADITLRADGKTYFFSNNYTDDKDGKNYNSIFMDTSNAVKNLTFNLENNGQYVINDSIIGGRTHYKSSLVGDLGFRDYATRYNTYFSSTDNTGTVFLADDIINSDIHLTNITMNLVRYTHENNAITSGGFGNDSNSRSSLNLTNSTLGLHNNYYDKLYIKNYTSAGNSKLHVNVGKDGGVWKSDILDIKEDINGQTQVIVYTLTKDNNANASVLFIKAPNDIIANRNAFEVYRVYGSPYMWTAVRNKNGETSGSNWYLVGNTSPNPNPELPSAPKPPEFIPPDPETPDPGNPDPGPDPDPEIEINPEVIAYQGLHSASIEQTRSMVSNIRSKVSANKVLPDSCLLIKDEAFDGQNILHNAWVNPIYHTANIDSPVDIDADIWGVEAGFDIQANQNHKLGIFASYRQGEYDLSGKGKPYYSDLGSKIDIDSYIGGLYYRYDYRHLWTFATLYGGVQKADIKTDDGIKADTDGTQVGGSVETGYLFNISDTLKLEPSLGLFYTQVDFDDIKDSVGKKASYKTIRQTEIEFGAKLEKYFLLDKGIGKLYVKPSVVQVITSGDSVSVTGLGKLNTYDDGTLGRVEIGGRYAISDQLSTYGFVNYTFGSNYDATSVGVGLNYSW